MKKEWNLTKYGKYISWVCCGASFANVFVKSDLVQNLIWCVLAVALLLIILDADEITERLIEAEFCDEDLKEQFNAIVWESYFDVMRKSNEFRAECDVAEGRNREAEKGESAEHSSDQDIPKIS